MNIVLSCCEVEVSKRPTIDNLLSTLTGINYDETMFDDGDYPSSYNIVKCFKMDIKSFQKYCKQNKLKK